MTRPEPVNLVAALHDSLMAFEQQIAKGRVNVVFEPKARRWC